MVTYSCCPQDKYPNLDYSLKLQRKSKFYSQNLLVPCVLISMLAPFTFLLPGNKLNMFLLHLNVSGLGGEDLAWRHHFVVANSFPADCCRADAAIGGNVFLVFSRLITELKDIPIIGEFYLYTMALVSTSILVTIAVLPKRCHLCLTHNLFLSISIETRRG